MTSYINKNQTPLSLRSQCTISTSNSSNKYLPQLNSPLKKSKKKVIFSKKLTVVYIESYKKYNQLSFQRDKDDKIRCKCVVF